jgi:hypothetical protein
LFVLHLKVMENYALVHGIAKHVQYKGM